VRLKNAFSAEGASEMSHREGKKIRFWVEHVLELAALCRAFRAGRFVYADLGLCPRLQIFHRYAVPSASQARQRSTGFALFTAHPSPSLTLFEPKRAGEIGQRNTSQCAKSLRKTARSQAGCPLFKSTLLRRNSIWAIIDSFKLKYF